jgi:hypothetical protein
MIEAPESKLKEHLEKLQQAYAIVFDDRSPMAQLVMEDLAKFCRANETCFHADPRIHAVAEGRRETFLRIKQYSTLNFKALYAQIVIQNDKPRSPK